MSAEPKGAPRPLPDRPNLRHLKAQARDLLKAGAAHSVADAQFQGRGVMPLVLIGHRVTVLTYVAAATA